MGRHAPRPDLSYDESWHLKDIFAVKYSEYYKAPAFLGVWSTEQASWLPLFSFGDTAADLCSALNPLLFKKGLLIDQSDDAPVTVGDLVEFYKEVENQDTVIGFEHPFNNVWNMDIGTLKSFKKQLTPALITEIEKECTKFASLPEAKKEPAPIGRHEMKRAEKFIADNNLKPKAGAKKEAPIFVDDILMPAKKRGRPSAAAAAAKGAEEEEEEEDEEEEEEEEDEEEQKAPVAKKKRGRPPAVKKEEEEEGAKKEDDDDDEKVTPAAKKRGRPSAVKQEEEEEGAKKEDETDDEEEEKVPQTQSAKKEKKQELDLATASRPEMMKSATVFELRNFLKDKAVEFTTDDTKTKLITRIYEWRRTM